MKIAFVDLQRQNKLYRKELLATIQKVVAEASFTMGPYLDNFEKEFASFCRRKYAVGLNSGTDALEFALTAHGIGQGDEVITVPNSYFSTAMVVSNVGAKPVFVDIDSGTFTIDTTLIEAKINKRTKAIIPVHLYGQPADIDPIIKLAKKYNLLIIEDCCQAHGAEYKDKRVPYAGTGAFSFFPGKNLGCFGDGGALVTDNQKIKEKVEYFRNDGSRVKYIHETFGRKSRLHALQAAILSVKLKRLSQFNRQRRMIAQQYDKLLGGVEQITTPKPMSYAKHVYHLYVIECAQRDKLQKYLGEQGISTGVHYPTPIHLQKPYREQGHKVGDFPEAEERVKKILSLPIFPEMTEKEVKFVCQKIKRFYSVGTT